MDSEHSESGARNAAGRGGDEVATPAVAALRAVGLQKTFGSRTVLHRFTMEIQPGEVRAMLGQNGSGKSTFIKILSGFHVPDDGAECLIRGEQLEFGSPPSSARLGLRFVHQDLGLVAASSILDNLAFTRGFESRFGTIRSAAELDKSRAALELVGLSIDPRTPVSRLTPVQRTGVAVARAAYQGDVPAAVIVLDEPTATLPAEEVQHLHAMIRRLAATGIGVLYVSHHLDEVFQLANTVSVLRDGYLVESSEVKDVDHTTLFHSLVGSELEEVRRTRDADHLATGVDTTFKVSDLHADFVNGVSMETKAGEIVGFYGLTGSGRESILGTIFGSLPRDAGTVAVNGTEVRRYSPIRSIAAGMGYVSPNRKVDGGFMKLDATENLTIVDVRPFWKRAFLRDGLEHKEAAGWFERLHVSPRDGLKQVLASFSGGNQQKLVLGKWLRVTPKVLLLDEPTQGVDVGAKAQLHRIIIQAANEGAIVLISSTDVEELATLCDRVLILRGGQISVELTGDDVNEPRMNREALKKAPSNVETAAP